MPLAASLAAILPEMAYILILAMATVLTLMGMAPMLQDAIDRVTSTTGTSRVRALEDLKKQFESIFLNPAVQAALLAQGAEAPLVAAQVSSFLDARIASSLPPLLFPTFASRTDADSWYAEQSALYSYGLVSADDMVRVQTWYEAELARLATPAYTMYSVPGVGTVGVRVTVGAGTTVPITAPAPTAPSVIYVTPPAITVPPAEVTVYPPAVTVITPEAPPPSVTNNIDLSGMLTGLLPALAALGGTFANALTDTAQARGHQTQLGQSSCYGTTASRLLANTLPSMIGLFGVAALSDTAGIGSWVRGQLAGLIDAPLDSTAIGDTPEAQIIRDRALTRLQQAMQFGIKAHLWAVAAESNFITKNLGLGQVAGFMADLAGFGRIAMATMGTVEQASLVAPMRLLAQRQFRPAIPGVGDLLDMYARRYIPESAPDGGIGLRNALELQGMPDDWIAVYEDRAYRDLPMAEIVRVAQYMSPSTAPGVLPPDYYERRLERAGYDPGDIPIMRQVAERSTCRLERTGMLATVTAMARDGYIDEARVRDLTTEAWALTDPVLARIRLASLRAEYETVSDAEAVTVLAMVKGAITRDEARDLLTGMGISAQRAELKVLKGTLGMIPGMRVTITRPEAVLEEAGVEE